MKFADIYAMSEERDTKHGSDLGDIEYVEIRIGHYGLDNMHPTDIGYALMANQIIKQLDPNPTRLVSKETIASHRHAAARSPADPDRHAAAVEPGRRLRPAGLGDV